MWHAISRIAIRNGVVLGLALERDLNAWSISSLRPKVGNDRPELFWVISRILLRRKVIARIP